MLGARQILVGSLLQVKCKIKETLHFPWFYLIPVFFFLCLPYAKERQSTLRWMLICILQ